MRKRSLSKQHKKAISKGLKAHHSKRKATLKRSTVSKSGYKTWRQRQKQKRPGLWSNVHAKRHREGK